MQSEVFTLVFGLFDAIRQEVTYKQYYTEIM